MMQSHWMFTIKDGRLYITNRDMFDAFISAQKDGTKGELTLQNVRKDKTSKQLRYYFRNIVAPMSDATGYEKDECDGILKRQFLTKNRGEQNEFVESKANLTVDEMRTYIDECVRWLIKNGIFVESVEQC